jgi:glycosyltransferase involved in cell wall biosynthesis
LLLVEAAQRILSNGKLFELVLAGDGEMRKDIEAMIERHHLQSSVRITGWISGNQVRNEILASRGLVLPSFAEGLPVAIMEAMALGRPVISTYIAGIPELVQEQKHGWLIPAGDLDSLTSAIEACLDSSTDQLATMGIAGRQRVLARHDINIEAEKLSHLFKIASTTVKASQ